jgi:hypothetical protein
VPIAAQRRGYSSYRAHCEDIGHDKLLNAAPTVAAIAILLICIVALLEEVELLPIPLNRGASPHQAISTSN